MRLLLSLMLFVAACLFAGLYGAVHNQISYTVATEYFTAFKFHQFQISPDIPERFGASIVGWYASWWMGLIIGAVLIPYAFAIPGPREFAVATLRAFAMVAFTALVTGAAALLVAFLWIRPDYAGEFEPYGNDVVNDFAFARAGAMHSLVTRWPDWQARLVWKRKRNCFAELILTTTRFAFAECFPTTR